MTAETVIAISGRVPAIESRIMPPSASPRLKRLSRASVLLARLVPAIQVATAPAAKTSPRSGQARLLIENVSALYGHRPVHSQWLAISRQANYAARRGDHTCRLK